jgi:hypothetical protein
MPFGQIFGNRHPVLSHEEQTVAVFVHLHLVARTDPAAELGLR